MSTKGPYNIEDLAGMTDHEILLVLDDAWPFPLDAVQSWFESLWNNISSWVEGVKTWINDNVVPLFTNVWNWLEAAKNWIVENLVSGLTGAWAWIQSTGGVIVDSVSGFIGGVLTALQDGINWLLGQFGNYFDWLWKWLQDAFTNLWSSLQPFLQSITNQLNNISVFVGDKVSAINDWFSNEFIDPFIDWLLQFPKNMSTSLLDLVNGLASRLESWLGHHSPGFPGILLGWLQYILDTIKNASAWVTGYHYNVSIDQAKGIWSLLGLGLGSMFTSFYSVMPRVLDAIAPALSDIGIWIQLYAEQFGIWLLQGLGKLFGLKGVTITGFGTFFSALLPKMGGWFMSNAIPLLGAGGIITAEATGKLQDIIDAIVTPALSGLLNWAESQGPIAPESGANATAALGRLASFTMGGLASMTLAGEVLSPLKHLGLGHVAAIVYDFINYKTLTAAFVGVLAAVYIKTPLTYYYNKAARPNIPNERGLADLASNYEITKQEFIDWMAYHGYADSWSDKLYGNAFRPMTPYMLRSLAEAGLLDPTFLDAELRHAGYREEALPFIKQMMANLAGGSLAAVSTSTAMTRYQEGFDDETTLRQNLLTLGVSPDMMDRYIFAATLKYLYDYQVDIKNFYVDQYHRREIEAPELRSSLAAAGLNSDRIDLVIQAQSIKRLKAAAADEDPAVKVQEETIRARREKNLITHDQEVSALVALGRELAYASAIADQDDVKLAVKVPVTGAAVIPFYETDIGKVQLATVRWSRLKGQIDNVAENNQLQSLAVPADLAAAYTAEDTVRITTKQIVKPPLAQALYETEAGKTETDTIRRLRRGGQLSDVDELNALLNIEMPRELAQAIVDNDTVRMTKLSSSSA